ncbi:hypothetical protein ACFP3Q_01025 [Nocardioides sp. GCM10027113]|uniref:hypothetical protein n=1 Tax=unclassified Nocardioides TaxID=2615069 RepID=UPI0036235067
MGAAIGLVMVAAAFLVGLQVGRSAGRATVALPAGPELAVAEETLRHHRHFEHHLRELVWQHRDLDPDLATIVLDEFRRFEQDPSRWRPPPGSTD